MSKRMKMVKVCLEVDVDMELLKKQRDALVEVLNQLPEGWSEIVEDCPEDRGDDLLDDIVDLIEIVIAGSD